LSPASLLVLHSSPTKRKPSRVTDEDGPTLDADEMTMEEVDEIPELKEIMTRAEMPPGPIPHQPWRRGETNGCEDPITADWRVEAEEIITKAAKLVGGKVVDVTWYLTQVLVTLDEDLSDAQDLFKDSGPVITIRRNIDPIYYDPNDPKPEDIYGGEGEIVYQKETEEEAAERKEKKRNMYAKKDEFDPEDEPHIPEEDDDLDEVGLYMNEETRGDAAYTEALEAVDRYEYEERDLPSPLPLTVDTAALSTIAGAILEALKDVEKDLKILSRHELVLTSPAPPGILETQKQFDAHRGELVIVETVDLKGRLLDRNSMDVLINKKGRMVTIPLNFVRCVKVELPEEEDAEEADEEYEYEYVEEEEEEEE
jgi:ribosome maturation factor RimP